MTLFDAAAAAHAHYRTGPDRTGPDRTGPDRPGPPAEAVSALAATTATAANPVNLLIRNSKGSR